MQQLRLGQVDLVRDPIHHEYAAGRHRGTGIATTQCHLPTQSRPLLGKLLQDPILTPDRIPPRAQPLGPVFGLHR